MINYKFEIDDTDDICSIVVTGSYRRDKDSLKLKQLASEISKETGCLKFLFDMTNAEIESKTMSSYNAGNPSEDIAKPLRNHKTAVLLSKITDDDHFFETVAVNRGFSFNIFDDHKKAVEWLKSLKIPDPCHIQFAQEIDKIP